MRWTAIGAVLIAVTFGFSLALGQLFYPEQMPWNKSDDADRIRAFLTEHADAIRKMDTRRACQRLWRAPPGSDACERHIRWFREDAQAFTSSRFSVHKVETDVHRTRVDAWIEAVGPAGSKHYDVAFIVSCSADGQVIGPDCPLWLSGASPRSAR